MNKTLYVKEEDGPIWDKARELTGDKLSQFIMEKLRAFVSERAGQDRGYKRIVLRFYEDQLPRAKAFMGRWIIGPGWPLIFYETQGDYQNIETRYLVAETPKGNFAVLKYHPLREPTAEGDETIDGHYFYSTFHVLQTVEDMSKEISVEVASAVMKLMGVQVQELDI